MAHGRPWYKRNGGDFVMATMHFPDNDHRWAYSSIVDTLNDRDRPIADDPGFICGIASLSKQKWTKVRAYLLHAGYLTLTEDGSLTNPRFERERAEREAEHERSVAAGRAGGRKSAAARGTDQGDLGLSGGKPATKLEESYQQSSNLVETNIGLPEAVQAENKDLAQPPPQATRAREEARGESPEEESTTANPTTAKVAVDVFDLYGQMQRLCSIGAVAVIRPTDIAREVDTVKAWIAAAYDMEGTVIPTIERQLANTKQDTIGSLNFYSPAIAKAHATASRKPKAQAGPKPVVMFPDEDPRMSPLRSDLLQALGEWAYVTFLNKVRLEPVPVEDMGDDPRRPLQLVGPQNLVAALFDGERRRIMTTTARRHGFSDVWK